jgi:hypothetical protein
MMFFAGFVLGGATATVVIVVTLLAVANKLGE